MRRIIALRIALISFGNAQSRWLGTGRAYRRFRRIRRVKPLVAFDAIREREILEVFWGQVDRDLSNQG